MVCGLVRHHCHCCAARVGHVLAGTTCAWRLPGQHGPWPAGAPRGHTLRLSTRPILPRISKTGKRALRTRRIRVKEARKKIHVPLVRVPAAVNIAAKTWKCFPKRMFTNVLTKK
jgi:hypothetical protein